MQSHARAATALQPVCMLRAAAPSHGCVQAGSGGARWRVAAMLGRLCEAGQIVESHQTMATQVRPSVRLAAFRCASRCMVRGASRVVCCARRNTALCDDALLRLVAISDNVDTNTPHRRQCDRAPQNERGFGPSTSASVAGAEDRSIRPAGHNDVAHGLLWVAGCTGRSHSIVAMRRTRWQGAELIGTIKRRCEMVLERLGRRSGPRRRHQAAGLQRYPGSRREIELGTSAASLSTSESLAQQTVGSTSSLRPTCHSSGVGRSPAPRASETSQFFWKRYRLPRLLQWWPSPRATKKKLAGVAHRS
jgi:hypothetical protein